MRACGGVSGFPVKKREGPCSLLCITVRNCAAHGRPGAAQPAPFPARAGPHASPLGFLTPPTTGGGECSVYVRSNRIYFCVIKFEVRVALKSSPSEPRSPQLLGQAAHLSLSVPVLERKAEAMVQAITEHERTYVRTYVHTCVCVRGTETNALFQRARLKSEKRHVKKLKLK